MSKSDRHSARRSLHADDNGAAIVSFVLTLPIFWTIVAIFVQLALLLTARLYVNHAAWTTARSAATLLAEDQAPRVYQAAATVLAPLSPAAPQTSDEGDSIAEALEAAGVDHARRFAERYEYAAAATEVEWTGLAHEWFGSNEEFSTGDGDREDLTLRYHFFLTVPIAREILSPRVQTIGGVTGRFIQLERTVPFERSPGRSYGRWDTIALYGMFEQ